MSQSSYERITQAGLEFLLTRVLSPRVSIDDAMWYVRGLYAVADMSDQERAVVRERVARMLARLRGHGSMNTRLAAPGRLG